MFLRIISVVLIHAFLVSSVAFAAPDANKHTLSLPSRFWDEETVRSIRDGETYGKSFRNRVAFRDISKLIGRYLHLGISSHTLIPEIKKHVDAAELAISKTYHDVLLAGYELDELTYNKEENAYYLPIYRGGVKKFYYKYYLDGDEKSVDITIRLKDGKKVYVRIENADVLQKELNKEELVRILVSLASFGHGTNEPTEVIGHVTRIQANGEELLRCVLEKPVLEDHHQVVQEIYAETRKAAIITRGLYDKAMAIVTSGKAAKGDFDEAELLSWEDEIKGAYRMYLECKTRLDAVKGDIRPHLLGEEGLFLKFMDESLGTIVPALLDRSSLIDGQISQETFTLNDIFINLSGHLASIAEKGVRQHIEIRLPEDPIWITGNKISIVSLICNLVDDCFSYATKFKGKDGKVVVELKGESGTAVITTSDNGEGILPEQLKEIWEPFHATKGTGIGLTESRLVAKDHGGTIEVESEVGKGTTFTVRLPIDHSSAESTPSATDGLETLPGRSPQVRQLPNLEGETFPDLSAHKRVIIGLIAKKSNDLSSLANRALSMFTDLKAQFALDIIHELLWRYSGEELYKAIAALSELSSTVEAEVIDGKSYFLNKDMLELLFLVQQKFKEIDIKKIFERRVFLKTSASIVASVTMGIRGKPGGRTAKPLLDLQVDLKDFFTTMPNNYIDKMRIRYAEAFGLYETKAGIAPTMSWKLHKIFVIDMHITNPNRWKRFELWEKCVQSEKTNLLLDILQLKDKPLTPDVLGTANQSLGSYTFKGDSWFKVISRLSDECIEHWSASDEKMRELEDIVTNDTLSDQLKMEKLESDMHPEPLNQHISEKKPTPESEQVHANYFKDKVKLQEKPIIIALGTSWITGYDKRRYPMHHTLNPLVTNMEQFCVDNGIPFIVDRDENLLGCINEERGKEGYADAKVLVLAGDATVKNLKEQLANACMAGVDGKNVRVDSYIRLMEMLTALMELSKEGEITKETIGRLQRDHPKLGAKLVGGLVVFELPDEKPMDYEELRDIYKVQRHA